MKPGFSIRIFEKNVSIEQNVRKGYDEVYFKTSKFEFVLEGLVLNKKELMHDYAVSSFETFLHESLAHKGIKTIEEFEGEFRGMLYDQQESKVYLFTNATATQNIYYTNSVLGFFATTSLIGLQETLKKSNSPASPDMEAMYQLLALGNLLEDKTPLSGVYKILDGHYLEVDVLTGSCSSKSYFSLPDDYTPLSKARSIDRIHEIFSKAIALEYKKDEEFATDHVALLSGGLDSRVSAFYAAETVEKPDLFFCFSQTNYFDHKISKKIADDFGVNYEFVPLDGGAFLTKIDQLAEVGEGMVSFSGGIHVQHAMDKMRYQNFKIFHSGQIGDGVLGGFTSEPKKKNPSVEKMVVNASFFSKMQASFQKSAAKYESEEKFLLRNLAYNRTFLGAMVLQQKAYQTSAFMNKDFLSFAFSLPEEWKYGHQLYIEWINKHCVASTKYVWERTLLRPDAHWKTKIGEKYVKNAYKIFNKKILQAPEQNSMYPYQWYFDQSPELQKTYDLYFDENIGLLENCTELREDIIHLYQYSDYFKKASAIHILAVFKLFFK